MRSPLRWYVLLLTLLGLSWTLVPPTEARRQSTSITSSGTLPATCTVGNIYLKTGSAAGLYACATTDVWTGPLSTGDGDGDVVGPASASDNGVVLFDGTTGKLLEGATGTGVARVTSGVWGAPGAVSLASEVTGDLPYANLTQGSALSVLGVTGNSTADVASMAAGTDHQVLRRSGTALAFGQVNLAQSAAITGILPVTNGGTGLADAAVIRRVSVTLTDAEFKATPTSGYTVLAAPGSGLYINPVLMVLQSNFAAGAYTNVNTTYAALWGQVGTGGFFTEFLPNDSTTTPPITSLTAFVAAQARVARLGDFLQAVGASPTWVVASATTGGRLLSDNVNQAFILYFDNSASGDLTGGNAANTLKVTLYYTLESQ